MSSSTSTTSPPEESRWYLFYREVFSNVCHNNGVDFQRIFPDDVRTLYDFIDNNYPTAILTTLQNADSITIAFIESALPLLVLSIQFIKRLLVTKNVDQQVFSWALEKLDDIDSVCLRVMYEVLILPTFHSLVQELAVQFISEMVSVSSQSRHQLVKKVRYHATSSSHHRSCFATIFYIAATQRNNFKLLSYFAEIIIQMSCHEASPLSAAIADAVTSTSSGSLSCYKFLSRHLQRIVKFSDDLDHSRPGPTAFSRDILLMRQAAYNISCAFATFLTRSKDMYKRIRADVALGRVVSEVLQSSHRPDLLRVIEEARFHLNKPHHDQEQLLNPGTAPSGMPRSPYLHRPRTAPAPLQTSRSAKTLPTSKSNSFTAFVAHSPSPGTGHHYVCARLHDGSVADRQSHMSQFLSRGSSMPALPPKIDQSGMVDLTRAKQFAGAQYSKIVQKVRREHPAVPLTEGARPVREVVLAEAQKVYGLDPRPQRQPQTELASPKKH